MYFLCCVCITVAQARWCPHVYFYCMLFMYFKCLFLICVSSVCICVKASVWASWYPHAYFWCLCLKKVFLVYVFVLQQRQWGPGGVLRPGKLHCPHSLPRDSLNCKALTLLCICISLCLYLCCCMYFICVYCAFSSSLCIMFSSAMATKLFQLILLCFVQHCRCVCVFGFGFADHVLLSNMYWTLWKVWPCFYM